MVFFADVPPSAVRDLHDQPGHVQPLQHSIHRVTLATTFTGILGQSTEHLLGIGIRKPLFDPTSGLPGAYTKPAMADRDFHGPLIELTDAEASN